MLGPLRAWLDRFPAAEQDLSPHLKKDAAERLDLKMLLRFELVAPTRAKQLTVPELSQEIVLIRSADEFLVEDLLDSFANGRLGDTTNHNQ